MKMEFDKREIETLGWAIEVGIHALVVKSKSEKPFEAKTTAAMIRQLSSLAGKISSAVEKELENER